ncbi:unnamed protein product [Gulo gulo]|uniref:Uncharacterized protein n=1 Tax=Gulo gulo TaxID=48420 RepID=A0A9X9LX29_GULGU|nr:unnamed protein product [Gulo gulo]
MWNPEELVRRSVHSWKYLVQIHQSQQQQSGRQSQPKRYVCDRVFYKVSASWGISDANVTLAVLEYSIDRSMMIPHSASRLSTTQAGLKDFFPISAASFSNFSLVLLWVPPHL